MQSRDHARLLLARDRALAAALSRNSAASLADACPGLGPGADPVLWLCSDEPDGHDDVRPALAPLGTTPTANWTATCIAWR